MTRSLANIVDDIERIAKDPREPRTDLLKLVTELRQSRPTLDETDPVRAAVLKAVASDVAAGADHFAMLNGSYMTVSGLCAHVKHEPSSGNLARIGKVLGDLGFVRTPRTRLFPVSRWMMPRHTW